MKKIIMVIACMVMTIAMGTVAFAADPVTPSSVTTVLTGSFQTMITDMMGVIAGILPIALPILGLSILIAFSIKWFKKIVGKA